MKFLRERLGEAVGLALAPIAEWISHRRHARTFHPDGLVFHARVTGLNGSSVGKRLSGPAIVRCGGALWKKGHQWPDALGVAIRFLSEEEPAAKARSSEQDVLFATILSPLTMALSPFTTNVTDFFRNHVWAVAAFDAKGLGRVKLRLSPHSVAAFEGTREERLRALVHENAAGWTLEARRTFTLGWRPLAMIKLEREIEVDQNALEFSPFSTGRGLEPRGFIHALRKAVYPASRRGRRQAALADSSELRAPKILGSIGLASGPRQSGTMGEGAPGAGGSLTTGSG